MNKWTAEIIGTFNLVFFGCGAIIVNDLYPNTLGHLGISLAFGLIVMAMIYSIGNVSGAHLNPAVTLGFAVAKRFTWKEILPYWTCQCLGAIIGAALLKFLFPSHTTLGATLPSVPLFKALITEIIFSFALMFIILNVSTGHKEKGIMAGVAVGGTIVFAALVGGPISGASLNPARSLGPALLSGSLADFWIYILGPCVGTYLAHPFCSIIQGNECCEQPNEEQTHGK